MGAVYGWTMTGVRAGRAVTPLGYRGPVDVVSSVPWSAAEVLALAADARAAGAARRIAVPVDWTGLGQDDEALWGMYRGGSGAEPYQVAVSLAEPAYRCS